MKKSRNFSKPGKKASSKKSSEPETEIEFLNAADEQEKGGHKWKAGDAIKATRFFSRALDLYNNGLGRYPESFDLAYNKAHLTFELTQDPRIAPHLGVRAEVLRETLEAHRYALRLNEDNPDILFNTAQVLTSLADEVDDVSRPDQQQAIVRFLQEAVELFGACLQRQEMLLYELQATLDDTKTQVHDGPDGMSSDADSSPTAPTTQWATVEEPVTGSTVLDTAVALLSCLEGLLAASIPSQSSNLAAIAELAAPLIHTKIPSYVSLIPDVALEEAGPVSVPTLSISANASATFAKSNGESKPKNPRFEARMESGLAVASFQTSLAEAEYRSNLSTLDTFSSRIFDAYEPIMSDRQIPMNALGPQDITEQDVEATVAYAEAFSNTLGPAEAETEGPMTPSRAEVMVKGLSRTDELLAHAMSTYEASQRELPLAKRAQIYLLRGDMSLRLSRILTTISTEGIRVAECLRQAEGLYRSADTWMKQTDAGTVFHTADADVEEIRVEAYFKSILSTAVIRQEYKQFKAASESGVGVERAGTLLGDAVREGLIDRALADQLWT